VVEPLQGVSDQ